MSKYDDVYQFVENVLDSIGPEWSQDIIYEFYLAVESHENWSQRYQELLNQYDNNKSNVNQAINRHIRKYTGRTETLEQKTAESSTLINSYSQIAFE